MPQLHQKENFIIINVMLRFFLKPLFQLLIVFLPNPLILKLDIFRKNKGGIIFTLANQL